MFAPQFGIEYIRNQFQAAPHYQIIRSSRLLAVPAAITTDSALYIPSPLCFVFITRKKCHNLTIGDTPISLPYNFYRKPFCFTPVSY